MGHTIVERLPRSLRWQAVVALLVGPHLRVDQVADASAHAAEARLRALRRDPSLIYCFWLLVRLAAAARDEDFVVAAAQLGVRPGVSDSAPQFIARVADATRGTLVRYPESGPFGEMAALALRAALRETVGIEGRSLFGSSLEDLVGAFRRHSSPVQFGDLAHRFFADFIARTLRYYIDRELPIAVGGGDLSGVSDAVDFTEALDLHVRQQAKAVERYAAQWYAKKQWERLGAIGIDDAADFVAHAMSKLTYALKLAAAR